MEIENEIPKHEMTKANAKKATAKLFTFPVTDKEITEFESQYIPTPEEVRFDENRLKPMIRNLLKAHAGGEEMK